MIWMVVENNTEIGHDMRTEEIERKREREQEKQNRKTIFSL